VEVWLCFLGFKDSLIRCEEAFLSWLLQKDPNSPPLAPSAEPKMVFFSLFSGESKPFLRYSSCQRLRLCQGWVGMEVKQRGLWICDWIPIADHRLALQIENSFSGKWYLEIWV
jgi:hypothetical protein